LAHIWYYNIPFHGHVNPSLPLIKELVRKDHQVTYYSSETFKKAIEGTGAQFKNYENLYAFEKSRADTHIIRLGGLVAEATYALLPEVLDSVASEKPDLLLFDMSAPWGGIASRKYSIPSIAIFPHLPFYWRTVFNDARVLRKVIRNIRPGLGYWRQLQRMTAKIVRDYQLRDPKDINVLSSSAELNIVFSSRYFQPDEKHFGSDYVYSGAQVDAHRQEEPFQDHKSEEQKLVYIAVGTVYQASSEFFKFCLDAFGDEGYSVVMSIGMAVNPESLGSLPGNFQVAQFVPQLAILQQADVFITHGGMNSINESVYFRVPLIVVPNTIEQAINAARVEQLGAGIYLEHDQLTVSKLRESVRKILTEDHYVSGLEKIRDSFYTGDGLEIAVKKIEELVQ